MGRYWGRSCINEGDGRIGTALFITVVWLLYPLEAHFAVHAQVQFMSIL